MNPAQIHLLANHLPLFGAGAAMLLLAYGLVRGQAVYQRLGCVVLVLAALSTPVAYFSGEGAEEKVEDLAGIRESRIHAHEEAAEAAAMAIAFAGLLAAAQLFAWALPSAARWRARGSLLLLVASALVFGWMGWTSHLGGLIRHGEELGAPAPAATGE